MQSILTTLILTDAVDKGGPGSGPQLQGTSKETASELRGLNYYQGVFYSTRERMESVLRTLKVPAKLDKVARGFRIVRTDTGKTFGPKGWK